jgi:hypothetical protein
MKFKILKKRHSLTSDLLLINEVLNKLQEIYSEKFPEGSILAIICIIRSNVSNEYTLHSDWNQSRPIAGNSHSNKRHNTCIRF